MPSTKTIFVCQNCGSQSPKWQGKCANCDSWNSYVEEKQRDSHSPAINKSNSSPRLLANVSNDLTFYPTLPEVDRVLGGGLVPGSLLLVGGAPGVGKSTLLLQIASRVAETGQVLYVSGEESESQTKLRAERLKAGSPGLHVLHEISLEAIVRHLDSLRPRLAVIDSIQTLYKDELGSAPGSVAQVRECTGELLRVSKSLEITIILIGHITKDGSIAGPRVLEHMVDTVLYFEGENHQAYRLLRAFKHRFGSTQEVGIFEMTGSGLQQVNTPSQLFLQSRTESSGSIVVPVIEGHRPLLMELQALVSRSWFGIPKRIATGVDFNRLALLIAVLEKRCRISLGQFDVYLNVAGALKIKEPAADLAIATAIFSSAQEKVIPLEYIAFGEVGLGGEIRSVPFYEERMREAAQLGFKKALVPKSNLTDSSFGELTPLGVGTLQEAIDILQRNEKAVPAV